MSDAVTALSGAVYKAGIAKISEVPLQGMITLRGDLSMAAVKKAMNVVVAGDMPGPGQARVNGDAGVAWMSPDELLLLCPYDQVAKNLDNILSALGTTHGLAVNVSDARASFEVSGPHAADVLAKLCPVDLSAGTFSAGMFRRTRMAQVPAALWLSGPESYQVICFRSQAQYVFDLLSIAAQPGSEVALI